MENNINKMIYNYNSTDNVGLQYYYLLLSYEKDKSNINILLYLLEYSIYLGSSMDIKKYINEIKCNINDRKMYFDYLLDKYNNIFKDNRYSEFLKNRIVLSKLFEKDYYIFIEKCNKKYIETLNSEYIFLMGQKMYYSGHYRHSFFYLNKYIEIGIISLREAYIYLFYISNNDMYLNKLYELIILDKTIDINLLREILLNDKDKKINKEIISLLHNLSKETKNIKSNQKKINYFELNSIFILCCYIFINYFISN